MLSMEFLAPSSEDWAWSSNQDDPTRIITRTIPALENRDVKIFDWRNQVIFQNQLFSFVFFFFVETELFFPLVDRNWHPCFWPMKWYRRRWMLLSRYEGFQLMALSENVFLNLKSFTFKFQHCQFSEIITVDFVVVRVVLLSQHDGQSASDEDFGMATCGCNSLLTFSLLSEKKPNIFLSLPPPPPPPPEKWKCTQRILNPIYWSKLS